MHTVLWPAQQAGTVIARLRVELKVNQKEVAQRAGLDQSRISRIEKGEVATPAEIERVLDALVAMGAPQALAFKEFTAREWQYVEPPLYWNPQRGHLEIAEETLCAVDAFLEAEDRPWPLRRQIERHQEALLSGSAYLNRLDHSIAFVGDIGVGKSTAISFLFELLNPSSAPGGAAERCVLETGGGRTTICEVHVKRGPEFGLTLQPMPEAEVRDMVSDFCTGQWAKVTKERKEDGESLGVGGEVERAIRNMAGLTRRRRMVDGKPVTHDLALDLARSCASEDEFRTRVLEQMHLPERTARELWYDSATRKHPMEWLTQTFRNVNNGRLKDVGLPGTINLIVPNFGHTFGELGITVIDTKGIDDVAIREDLDLRLKDPRTAVVFCSHFNDAPGTSAHALLRHMRDTFSERIDTGKVSIVVLPRSGEARAMKDDEGELAQADTDGYAIKQMHVQDALAGSDLSGVPITFFNIMADDSTATRTVLLGQLDRMRETAADRLFDLCAAVDDLIKNHEAQAVNAAVEEVANQLDAFLRGNPRLSARERLAHTEALNTVKGVRYAATLWAATRRRGEYSGLNVIHQVGVGAARDARSRCDGWFGKLDGLLNTLKADPDLALAAKSIDQIGTSAALSRTAFLEAVQRAGAEVYREPLSQAPVWSACASEWGLGSGFKARVADHLDKWFDSNPELKERLETIVVSLWEEMVIAPLRRLAEEGAPEAPSPSSNVGVKKLAMAA